MLEAALDRSRAARPLVALAMPIMVVANQFLAEHTARDQACLDVPADRQPWKQTQFLEE